tara:strand:- start:52 stop:1497 length:1446 start_codon:yes stop_codon:yes gene_type:complete
MPKILDTALQDPEVLRDLRMALAADRVRRGDKDPTALMQSSERRQVLAQKRAFLQKLNIMAVNLHESLATQEIKSKGELRLKQAELHLEAQKLEVDYLYKVGTINAAVYGHRVSALNSMTTALGRDPVTESTESSQKAAAARLASFGALGGELLSEQTLIEQIGADLGSLPRERGAGHYLAAIDSYLVTNGYKTVAELANLAGEGSFLDTKLSEVEDALDSSEFNRLGMMAKHNAQHIKVMRGAGAPSYVGTMFTDSLPTDEQVSADIESMEKPRENILESSGLQALIDQTMADIEEGVEGLPLDPDQVESRLLNSEGIAEIADTLGVTTGQAVKYAKRQYKQVDRGKRESFTPEEAKLRQFGKATRKAHRQERRAARKAGEEPEEFKAEASTPEEKERMIDASKGVKRGAETGALLEAIDLGAAAEIPESAAAAAAVSGAEPEVDEVQLAADKAQEEAKERQATGASRTKQLLASMSSVV